VRGERQAKGDNISTWFNQNEFMTSQKARDRLGWRPRHAGIIECVKPVWASWAAAQSAA